MHIPRLSSLKPLPPVAPPGSTHSQHGIKLLGKAITVSTASEKNDILNEVHELWPLMSNEYDEVTRSNREKEKQLKNLQDKLQKAQFEIKSLQESSDFYKLYNKHAITHPRAKYMTDCLKLQNEILRFTTIPPLARFEERFKAKCVNDQITSFALQDEYLHHLEQLAYELNKRKIIVEQSGESSEAITTEFGSLNGLLIMHKKLLDENEKLKAEEVQYASDPMTKRRKFDNFSCHSSRMLVQSIKDIIDEELDIAHGFEAPREVEEGIDFDSVIPTESDKTLNQRISFSDLQLNVSSSQIISTNNLQKQLELLAEYKKTVDKLEDEVRGGTKRSYVSDASLVSHNKADKVLETNFALIEKIDNYIVDIDDKNLTIDKIIVKLSEQTSQRKKVYQEYWKVLQQYKKLLQSHRDLTEVLNKNRLILSSLLTVVTSFGSDIIELFQQPDLKSYITKEIDNRAVDLQNDAPIPIPKHEESEENKRMGMKRKGSKYMMVCSSLESDSQLLANKMEIINALALSFQIGGYSINKDNNLHDPIKFMNKVLIGGIEETAQAQLGGAMKFFQENLTKLRMTTNLILVRDKVSLHTQTDELDRKNEEIMTEEPQKKNGKSK